MLRKHSRETSASSLAIYVWPHKSQACWSPDKEQLWQPGIYRQEVTWWKCRESKESQAYDNWTTSYYLLQIMWQLRTGNTTMYKQMNNRNKLCNKQVKMRTKLLIILTKFTKSYSKTIHNLKWNRSLRLGKIRDFTKIWLILFSQESLDMHKLKKPYCCNFSGGSTNVQPRTKLI